MNKATFIPHNQLSREHLIDIIKVKSAAWPYTDVQQRSWIKNNIFENDVHVLLKNTETVQAYLNLVDISISIDDKHINAYGIGNVCAIQKGKGWGKELLIHVNKYMINNNKVGLLFCKDVLVNFYKVNKWSLISKEQSNFLNVKNDVNALVYNYPKIEKELKFHGNSF